MNSSRLCPLCQKKVSDFLKHLRFTHEIEDIEEYETRVNEINKKKTKQREFSNYVEKLKKRKEKGEISPEEYRNLITKWFNQNKISD